MYTCHSLIYISTSARVNKRPTKVEQLGYIRDTSTPTFTIIVEVIDLRVFRYRYGENTICTLQKLTGKKNTFIVLGNKENQLAVWRNTG